MLINILFILPVTIVAITGHAKFAPGVAPFLNTIDKAADKQADLLDTIPKRLSAIDPNGTALRPFVENLSKGDGKTTRDHRTKSVNWFNQGELLRTLLLAFTWSFVFSCMVVGLLAIFLNNAKTSMCTAFLAFLCMFMVWWSLALVFPVSVGVSDFCYDLQVYTIERRMEDFRETKGEAYKGFNEVLWCPSFNRTTRTLEYVEDLRFQRTQVMAAMLNSSSGTPYNKTKYDTLASQVDELDDIAEDVVYVKNCAYVIPAYNSNLNSDVCGPNLQGLVTIWATMFALFILLAPLAVLGILGYKRLEIEGAGYF